MIKGILFDKDGTIIDFYEMWLNAALIVVPNFLVENEIEASEEMVTYILEVMGVCDGEIDPKGALAYKSYPEIAEDIVTALENKDIYLDENDVNIQLQELFNESVRSPKVKLLTFGDMKTLLADLKKRNIKIGLATADTLDSAQTCLKQLKIEEAFDFVGADDGNCNPKPAPDMFLKFAEIYELEPEEIMMVGDTANDIRFGKENGGMAVGVLSGVSKLEDYNEQADYVIESIMSLPELLDKM